MEEQTSRKTKRQERINNWAVGLFLALIAIYVAYCLIIAATGRAGMLRELGIAEEDILYEQEQDTPNFLLYLQGDALHIRYYSRDDVQLVAHLIPAHTYRYHVHSHYSFSLAENQLYYDGREYFGWTEPYDNLLGDELFAFQSNYVTKEPGEHLRDDPEYAERLPQDGIVCLDMQLRHENATAVPVYVYLGIAYDDNSPLPGVPDYNLWHEFVWQGRQAVVFMYEARRKPLDVPAVQCLSTFSIPE